MEIFTISIFFIIEEIASGNLRLDSNCQQARLRGGGSLFYYGDHKVDYFHQDATWKALESIPSEKIIDGLKWKGGVGGLPLDGVYIGYQIIWSSFRW